MIQQLLEVWEQSVRATHLFLSDSEINHIKEYVPRALEGIAHLVIAKQEGASVAFMGIADGTLEMLFIAPKERGKGLGKQLLCYGMEYYAVRKLAVNEQNPQARVFMSIWALRCTRERKPMSREIRIRCFICVGSDYQTTQGAILKLSKNDKAILAVIQGNPTITQKDCALKLGWAVERVKYYLRKMKKQQMIN